jgi:peroxiredoxin Q/BCP
MPVSLPAARDRSHRVPLIEPGKIAPDFSLKDQDGKTHALKDYRGHLVVLYFYPRDDTAGSTAQACQFRDHQPDFRKIKAVVLGVCPDDQASHANFARKHGLDFRLLSDPRGGGAGGGPGASPPVCDKYGAWGPKGTNGRALQGVTSTTYLIDPAGRVTARWDHVRPRAHVAEVLEAVKLVRASMARPLSPRAATKTASRAKPRQRTRMGDSDPPYNPRRGPAGTGAPRNAPARRHIKAGRGASRA